MKKSVILKISIILVIGLMLLLSCHTHPLLSPWDGGDDHCLLCQLLQVGFTCSLVFILKLLLNLFEILSLIQNPTVTIPFRTGYDNRAPPCMFLFN